VITVTERAREELKAILIAAEAPPDKGLRMLPTSDDVIELILDTDMSGDTVLDHEGYKVLIIGVEYIKLLDGMTLDCSDTEIGAVLFVR
jgi:Fe-S cluster assembly iron-binding protein IscA